eukprot:Gb_05110 [translate_table: standard]
MAGLFDKQAKEYLDARPTYPPSLFSMLASLTPTHSLAWDVGAGNGQASVGIAEHYDRVIATEVSRQQLEFAQKHPKVTYALTPPVLTEEALTCTVGPEGCVDLVTVAMAVHWFDLDVFYSQVKRLLRKPGGVIVVWCYHNPSINPAVDGIYTAFFKSTLPYWNPNIQYPFDGYRTLPFPFDPVMEEGVGREGNPLEMEMERRVSLDGYLGLFRSWSAVITAREKGVELLNEKVLKAFQAAWGDVDKVCVCKYQVFLLAGTSPLQN